MSREHARKFLTCEDGAVSADWIALTAGVVFLSFLMLMHFGFAEEGPLQTLDGWLAQVRTLHFGT